MNRIDVHWQAAFERMRHLSGGWAKVAPFLLAVPAAYCIGRLQGPSSRAQVSPLKLADISPGVESTWSFLLWTSLSFLVFLAVAFALWYLPGYVFLSVARIRPAARTMLRSTLLGLGLFVLVGVALKGLGFPLFLTSLFPLGGVLLCIGIMGLRTSRDRTKEAFQEIWASRSSLAFGLYGAAVLVLSFRHQLRAPPYMDEFYRLQFAVLWRDFGIGQNVLFYDGAPLLYYSLAELVSAVVSRFTGMEIVTLYFVGLLPFAWFLFFAGLGHAFASFDQVEDRALFCKRAQRAAFVALSPFAIAGSLLYHDSALGHFFMRQSMLGMALVVFGLSCFFPRKTLRDCVDYWGLLGVIVVTVAIKPPFALLLAATAGCLLILKGASPWWQRFLKAIGVIVFAQFLTWVLIAGGPKISPRLGYFQALQRSYPPSEFYTPWLTKFLEESAQAPLLFVLFQGMVFAPLVVLGLVCSVRSILFKDACRSLRMAFALSLFALGGLLVFGLFYVPVETGGSEHYFHFAAAYAMTSVTSLVSIQARHSSSFILRGVSALAIVSVLSGVYALFALAPRVHAYERHHPSVDDPDFVASLLWVRNSMPKDVIIVHNFARNPKSVAITAISERRQYLGYLPYGGVVTEPGKTERLASLDKWFDGGALPEILCGKELRKNAVVMYSDERTHLASDLKELTTFGKYRIGEFLPLPATCPQLVYP